MAPENVQFVHLKVQIQPDVDFFGKLLKDNQTQDINKNLNLPITPRRVRQLLHESPSLVYWKRKTALGFNC